MISVLFFKDFFWCGSFLKVFIKFVTILLPFYLFFFLARGHVGSWLPDQGSNPCPSCTGRQSLKYLGLWGKPQEEKCKTMSLRNICTQKFQCFPTNIRLYCTPHLDARYFSHSLVFTCLLLLGCELVENKNRDLSKTYKSLDLSGVAWHPLGT